VKGWGAGISAETVEWTGTARCKDGVGESPRRIVASDSVGDSKCLVLDVAVLGPCAV
jgi:hypothetical protein